jgi:peptide/nickel transport system substrate-binding protein
MHPCAAARPGRRCSHHVLAAVLVVLLAGCATSTPPAAPGRISGGTATVALQPGEQFNWIMPLINGANDTGANIGYSEYLMWRPLYWFGRPGHVGVNFAESLAGPATVTTAGTDTTATITLKPWRWSDGQPVTSRDVEFWFDLLKAEKANWWGYSPGQFPDDVSAFTILSPSRFSLTFDHRYSAAWLYNELGQLIPIPQQSWDKTSAGGTRPNTSATSCKATATRPTGRCPWCPPASSSHPSKPTIRTPTTPPPPSPCCAATAGR